jgi:hypothetical protein
MLQLVMKQMVTNIVHSQGCYLLENIKHAKEIKCAKTKVLPSQQDVSKTKLLA